MGSMMPWIGAAAGQATDAYNVRSDQNKMMDIQQAQNQRQERQAGMQEETFGMQKEAYQSQLDEDAANKAALYFSAFEAVPDDQKPIMWGPAVRSYKSLFKNNQNIQQIPEEWDPNRYMALKAHFQSMKTQAAMKLPPKDMFGQEQRDPVTNQLMQRNLTTNQLHGAGSVPATTNINTGTVFEKEEDKALAQATVKNFEEIDTRARASEQLLPQLEIASAMDVQTGALEPVKAKIQSWIQALPGGDAWKGAITDAGSAEALTGVMQNVVLSKMQAQKGPQTENDAKRIQMTVASLGNTPESFRFLMNVAIALERRNIDQRNFFLNFRERNKTLQGATLAWEKKKEEVPLVIKRPGAKLPMTFYQFQKTNPQYPEGDLVKEWQSQHQAQLSAEQVEREATKGAGSGQ